MEADILMLSLNSRLRLKRKIQQYSAPRDWQHYTNCLLMASKKASFCTSVPDFQGVGTSASLNSSFPHMCLSPHNHAFLQQVEIQNTMRILWLKKKKQNTNTVLQNPTKTWEDQIWQQADLTPLWPITFRYLCVSPSDTSWWSNT